MANLQSADGEGRVRRGSRSKSEWELEKPHKSHRKEKVTLEPDISEVRRIRIERLEDSTSTRSTAATPTMTSDSHATIPSLKSPSSHRGRKEQGRRTVDTKHHRRVKTTSKDDSTSTYVYGTPADRSQSSPIVISETRKLGRDGVSSESDTEEDPTTQGEPARAKPKKRKIRVVHVTEDGNKTSKSRHRRTAAGKESQDRPRETAESVRRSRPHISHRESVVEERPSSAPKRSSSTRDLPSHTRHSLKRSNTTSHIPTAKPSTVPSLSGTTATNKRSSFLGSFFGSGIQQHNEPERLIECLTCLSDDIPRSKSAKLKCGHRMCQPCLKRIFKLSVTDPQHMPPKCCTSEHIPLKHVERLFDNNFKRTWNKKFQEYSTKNRIYCPARRCGEWIKPGNIHKEDGKKYGKCGRCKTKVCCLCNGKWHGAKDCPKDEETNRLLEAAKQAGWQRCYSCRTMVELKEGCNHMTCRCTAEFCMICGLKWKSCNCPWFNYDTVEADRLNHMQVPVPAEDPEQEPHRLRRRPNNHRAEMNQRRQEERTGEELARRLQRVAMANDNDESRGGIGDVHGFGNGAAHFMNQDYIRAAHNILTGTYDHATAAANYVMGVAQARRGPPGPAPELRRMADRYPVPPVAQPVLRRHTAPTTRPSEIAVPRRIRTDYDSEAAVHAPAGRTPPRPVATAAMPRPSVLAGLRGAGSGNNRVNAWRTHVEPGVTPAEGVLSM